LIKREVRKTRYEVMIMRKYLTLAILLSTVFLAVCCKDAPTKPPDDIPLDTTSHNFTWQTFTLGDGSGSSTLYDVAIINDTLAYAVGEIYKKDSLGNWDPNAYGLAIWNGRNWKPKRIMVQSQQGDVHSRVFTGINAFSPTDVWFGDGNAFHWDGQSAFATAYWISGYPGNPTPVLGPNQGVNKFWGTSSSNLYGVGVNGGIAYYNGSWKKIETGITTPILDVWGVANNNPIVFGAVTNMFQSTEAKILTVNSNGHVDSIPWRSDLRISSIWTKEGKTLHVCGDGIFKRTNGIWEQMPVPNYYFITIRGSDENNIFAVGVYGMTVHYNGATWKDYPEMMIDGDYSGLDVKNNIVAIVGWKGSQAIAVIGKRQ
jgi:hypothetical protein